MHHIIGVISGRHISPDCVRPLTLVLQGSVQPAVASEC